MRKTISVAALLLALTCPAYAGDIQNESPKPQANTVQESAGDAQEPTANGEMQNDVTDGLTQIALDALLLLPSLF